MLSQQLPNQLDSVFPSSTDVCWPLKAQMNAIGKALPILRESLIIRLVYLFSASSHYVEQHCRRAKGCAVVLRSAPSLVLSWGAVHLAFTLYEPPHPTCMKLSSLNALSQSAVRAQPGAVQHANPTSSHLCANIILSMPVF